MPRKMSDDEFENLEFLGTYLTIREGQKATLEFQTGFWYYEKGEEDAAGTPAMFDGWQSIVKLMPAMDKKVLTCQMSLQQAMKVVMRANGITLEDLELKKPVFNIQRNARSDWQVIFKGFGTTNNQLSSTESPILNESLINNPSVHSSSLNNPSMYGPTVNVSLENKKQVLNNNQEIKNNGLVTENNIEKLDAGQVEEIKQTFYKLMQTEKTMLTSTIVPMLQLKTGIHNEKEIQDIVDIVINSTPTMVIDEKKKSLSLTLNAKEIEDEFRSLLKKNQRTGKKDEMLSMLSSIYHQSKKDIEEILLNMYDVKVEENKITLLYADSSKS